MARVTSVPSSALSPAVAKIYEDYASGYGPFRNQVAAFAHVPQAVTHIMGLLMELKASKNINWRYIELAIVVTSKLNECHYCVAHHTRPLEVEGLSRAAIDRLPETNSPELDEVDRLVVEYTIAVTRNAQRISRRDVRAASQAFHRGADRGVDIAHHALRLLQPIQRCAADRQRARRRGA